MPAALACQIKKRLARPAMSMVQECVLPESLQFFACGYIYIDMYYMNCPKDVASGVRWVRAGFADFVAIHIRGPTN